MKPRATSTVVYRLVPASRDRCDVEVTSDTMVTLRTDVDSVRLTLAEARSLAVYLTQATTEAERKTPP